jgi:F-type H+-transporting ATPase subunit b
MDKIVTALALGVFFLIVWKMGGFAAMMNGLDARGKRIAAELDEARRLREEAEKLLASFEAKRVAAEKEAETIVSEAKAEAERIRVDQEQRLGDFVARRTALAEQKIAQAEAAAAADVKSAAADAAVRAAEMILRGRLAGAGGDAAIARGIQDVKARLN